MIALVFLAGVLGLQSYAAISQTMYASFDADGNLSLTYVDGTVVAYAPPGTYQVVFNDSPADNFGFVHKFHLFGPGVDLSPAPGQAQAQWSVTFQANAIYTYMDDNALSMSRATFSTASSAATPSGGSSSSSSGASSSPALPSPKPAASGIAPFRGTLDGIVSAGKLTLARNGKSVSAASIKAGRYKIAVDDLTAKGGFTLQRLTWQPVTLTGATFVGRRSVTVALTAGRWEFFSAGGKKSYFVVT